MAQTRRQMSDRRREPEEWTADALVEDAAARGLHATRRLIRGWIEVGLLDRPRVRGRGPRRGVAPGTWSENQHRLLLVVLGQRQVRKIRRNPPLCNIPVWLWLTWGDDYVPLRQARRALTTWAQAARYPAVGAAEATGRSVVRKTRAPGVTATARRRLRDTVAAGQAGQTLTWEALAFAAGPVIDLTQSGLPRGPAGARLTAAMYADQAMAKVEAASALLSPDAERRLPAALFEDARRRYVATRASYAAAWHRFAADPDLGALHPEPTLGEVVQTACADLLLLLGLELTEPQRRRRRASRADAKLERGRSGF